jgi:hypothetical protein
VTGHDDGHRSHARGGAEANAGGRRAAEEAIRLLQTLTEFTGTHDGPECRICPVCQLLAALRQVRPEAVEHLVRASVELGAALRDLGAPEPQPPGTPDSGDSASPGSAETGVPAGDGPDSGQPAEQADAPPVATWPAPVPERLRVQRIEVTD